MNELEARERKRRYSLWDLARLHPGSDQAKPHLAILDDIERRDREEPIGEAWAMSIDELREHVPETEILGVTDTILLSCLTSTYQSLEIGRASCRERVL